MPADERSVRVFVSSTFRDMEAERDELAKRTFIFLRKLCAERGVTFTDVDLRWGITDEAAAEGRVLPICLEEIRRCRPFFIGILGERYGWVPDSLQNELLHNEPWLGQQHGRSVTELEVLHGVLNDPGMASRSYFYLRDPAYAEGKGEDYAETDPLACAKLAALKERIRASGLPVRENYADPAELGELVYEDLASAIGDLYPEGSEPDPLTSERQIHRAFAASRTRVYIGRKDYFDALERHLRSEAPPLVVVGGPGSGKSALLAEWGARVEAMDEELFALTHFVGAGAKSSDWETIVRRLAQEILSRFGIPFRIPAEPSELRTLLDSIFHMVSAGGGRAAIILDGLDQLDDRDSALDLPWLPEETPEGIRLVVSTLPGLPLREVVRRGWPQLQVHRLTADERRRLVARYLGLYRKELDEKRIEKIVMAGPSGDPLFLTTLLGELRLWGAHETLDQGIGRYLEVEDTQALFGRVLHRFEQDYERERPGLVRDTMRLLWAVRRGLPERELLKLLGGEDPMPRAYFSPLYVAAEEWFAAGSGLLRLAQTELRTVVEERYLPTEEVRRTAHLSLAQHFQGDRFAPQAVDELPWQLYKGQDWAGLGRLLSDLKFLRAAWAADRWDVHAYWAKLASETNLRVVDAYEAVLKSPEQHKESLSPVWELLTGMGYRKEVLPLRDARTRMCLEAGDRDGLHLALGDCARALIELGRGEDAWQILDEQERFGLGDGCPREESRLLHHRAMILQTRGEFDEALDFLRLEEERARQVGDIYALSYAIAGQSSLIMSMAASRGDTALLPQAEALSIEHERLSRRIGDRDGLADALQSQAAIRHSLGDARGGQEFFDEAEDLYRATGNRLQLASCLVQRSVSHRDLGDVSGALSRLEEAEEISRAISSPGTLAGALCLQADILQHLGRFGRALDKASEGLALAQGIGDIPKTKFAQMMVEGIRRRASGG